MRPARRLTRSAFALFLLSIVACLGAFYLKLWLGVLGLWVSVLLVDFVRGLRMVPPTVHRRVDTSLPLGVWSKVHLRVGNPSERDLRIRLHDFHPNELKSRYLPIDLEIPPRTEVDQYYEVKPLHRGAFEFAQVQMLIASPLQLWDRSLRLGECSPTRIYPDFRAVSKYMMLDVNERLAAIGIHRRRRRGEGRDFHQLRDYVRGDELRSVDWKATSRLQKMIVREYRDERDQQIVFLMDCGQAMRTQDGPLSHFDHALNGVLLLASVALRNGDGVGLFTFGGVTRRIAARKGRDQIKLLLDTVFDIQPGLHTADYVSLARDVLAHCRKRSLVVFVTNLKDEDGTELQMALSMLRKKHLVVLASMRERILNEVLDAEVTDFEDALRLAATHSYLQDRRKTHEALAVKGVIAIDVLPESLPISLVNTYFRIKAQGLL